MLPLMGILDTRGNLVFISILKKYVGIVMLAIITLLSVTTIKIHFINAGLNNKSAQLVTVIIIASFLLGYVTAWFTLSSHK